MIHVQRERIGNDIPSATSRRQSYRGDRSVGVPVDHVVDGLPIGETREEGARLRNGVLAFPRSCGMPRPPLEGDGCMQRATTPEVDAVVRRLEAHGEVDGPQV